MVLVVVYIRPGGDWMNIMRRMQDVLLGNMTTLYMTEEEIQIRQGLKSSCYELPSAFKNFNYLHRPEEMAGWLLAVLQNEKKRIRRCKIVLAPGQVFFQKIRLPEMTIQEQNNWLFWEGSQYIPYPANSCISKIIRWKETGVSEKDFSGESEKNSGKLCSFLIVAVQSEVIERLTRFAHFLNTRLEEVAVIGPDQNILPLNLLSAESWKERSITWCYQGLTVFFVFLSLALSAQSLIQWKRQELVWEDRKTQLAPLLSVKNRYLERKKVEHQIGKYRTKIQQIEQKNQKFYPALKKISETIPQTGWLEEIKSDAYKSNNIELKGFAGSAGQILDFAGKLKSSREFSGVNVAESGERLDSIKDRVNNRALTANFSLRAGISPDKEGGRP